jgi:hypothetical protein
MSANDWRQVMQRLDKHYGDNASLDAKTAAEIEAFLIRYAGSEGKYGGAAPAQAGEPPRLTPHAVVCAQAPRGLPCRLESSEGEIAGQLRRLSSPGGGGQFSRTRDRPAFGQALGGRLSHAKDSDLGLAGAPWPLADGGGLRDRLAHCRERIVAARPCGGGGASWWA